MDEVFMWIILITSIKITESADFSLQINEPEKIARRIGEDLFLNCSVVTHYPVFYEFKMHWLLPAHLSSSFNGDKSFSVQELYNEIILRIRGLQDEHSGIYTCKATSEDGEQRKNISLIVKPKKGACPDNHFRCSIQGHCIPSRYMCDGRADCPDKTDESVSNCGPKPCEGKIRCNDGRCLHRHLCCDPYLEPNCPTSHLIPCCMRFIHSTYSLVHPSVEQQKRYDNDLGFLQSTIYTVIGCAVAFVFIVTIMVIAVCRVHLKRSTLTSHPQTRTTAPQSQFISAPWEQRHLPEEMFLSEMGDPYLYGSPTPTPPNSANLLVAYNINSGMHFVGRLVKPPSYSQIAQEAFAPNDPPPPYRSSDNLSQVQSNCTLISPGFHYPQFIHDLQDCTSPGRPNIIVNRLSDSE